MTARFTQKAPAKVNLTLRVSGRRADGYHTLESLIAFADLADELSLEFGGALARKVRFTLAGAFCVKRAVNEARPPGPSPMLAANA